MLKNWLPGARTTPGIVFPKRLSILGVGVILSLCRFKFTESTKTSRCQSTKQQAALALILVAGLIL